MTSIQIFGVSNVGSLLAYRCACEHDIGMIYLTDINKELLQSQEADLQQAAYLEREQNASPNQQSEWWPEIKATERVEEADIYVICASASLKGDRMEQLAGNAPIVMGIAQEIANVRKEMSMTLIITNPSHTLAAMALDIIPFAIPTGNLLDNARLRMCKAAGQHEAPNIQQKCDLVKSGKGCTQFGPVSEAMRYIRGYLHGLESP